MRKLFEYMVVAGCIIAAGACATLGSHKGYVICNDTAPNVTCPDNTANLVVRM